MNNISLEMVVKIIDDMALFYEVDINNREFMLEKVDDYLGYLDPRIKLMTKDEVCRGVYGLAKSCILEEFLGNGSKGRINIINRVIDGVEIKSYCFYSCHEIEEKIIKSISNFLDD